MKNIAVSAAYKAGGLLRQKFGDFYTGRVKDKNQRNIVTKIDLGAEKIILDIIKKSFPQHQILSEEEGRRGPDSDYQWVIDPLDGTGNYARGIPFFCVSIGLIFKNKPILGVIYNPLGKELFVAEKGNGTFLNQKPIKASSVSEFAKAFGVIGWGHERDEIEGGAKTLREFCGQVGKMRVLGSIALSLAYVGAGKLDFALAYGMNLWDIAAAWLIIEEAGGRVTLDKHQEKYNILATNDHLHSDFLDKLKWPR